jgi:lipopolysaccharide transport system permease protein
MQSQEHWDLIIRPKNKWYDIDFRSIWKYRDLLILLVKRDFSATYKQTILGPLWLFIQPVISSFIFAFIFGRLARISTDGNPPVLFYMAGITLWTYFADCLNKTSSTLIANAGVFGKVYFPRLIIPLSILVSNLVKLGIQLMIFLTIWSYYLFFSSRTIYPHWDLIWLVPILILMMAGLGLGFGIIISALTTKYRDLIFLVGFGVQLLMYASSVLLPISSMPDKIKTLMLFNPLTSVIEAFKYVFLGSGSLEIIWLVYGFGFMILLVATSIIVFNKVEKSYIDTV